MKREHITNKTITFPHRFHLDLNSLISIPQQFYLSQAMSSKISPEHLEQLVRNGKHKDFTPYVDLILEQDPQAETAVAKTLNRFLVQRISKIPSHLLSAMVLYKKLMLSATMDFITAADFPQQIHQQIGKICLYKGTEQFSINRGSSYFIDTLQVQKNDQTQKMGIQYVLLALELVKCLAKWYPNEYDDKSLKSSFRTQYDKLLERKVNFPKEEEFKMVKPADEQLFKDNYEEFLESLNNNESAVNQNKSGKSQIVKEVKAEQKPNSLNIDNSSIQKKQPEMVALPNDFKSLNIPFKEEKPAKVPENKQSKPVQSNSKIVEPKSTIISKANDKESPGANKADLPKPTDKKQTAKTVQKPIPKEEKPPAKEQNNQLKIGKVDISRASVQQSKYSRNSSDLPDMPENSYIKPIKKPQDSVIDSIKKKQDSKIIPKYTQKDSATKSIKKQQDSKIIPINTAPLQKPPTKEVPKAESKAKGKVETPQLKPVIKPEETVKQQITPQPYYSFTEPKQGQPPSTTERKKMYKMQKPKKFYSGKNSPYKRQASPEQNRKRSIPKTQKANPFNRTGPMPVARKVVFDLIEPLITQDFQPKKTLAYFANSRKKAVSTQFQKYSTILQAIQAMRLDRYVLPYHPEYFTPLTPKMHSLRSSALNLFDSGQSFDYFYKSDLIEARIVKQSEFLFHLSLHNLSHGPVLVDPVDMSQLKYSNRIKILTWANRQEIHPCQLPHNGHMDIKFAFQTYDFNFKFLDFLIYVNQKLQTITLPLTLLDMCKIQTSLTVKDIQKYSLKGSMLVSKPFVLNKNGLPSFLGNFKYPTPEMSRQRRDGNQLIGTCSLKLEMVNRYEYYLNEVCVAIKMLNWQSLTAEINILYPTKDLEGQSLAKVLTYLLIFLLSSN